MMDIQDNHEKCEEKEFYAHIFLQFITNMKCVNKRRNFLFLDDDRRKDIHNNEIKNSFTLFFLVL